MSSSDVTLADQVNTAEVPRPASASGFRPVHFFVLASLMAATVAVVMSRQSTPEHLVLISVVIASAGLAAAGFYRMLAPLVGDGAAPVSEALSERARAVLTREKALALRALKDLEFDRKMGKVSQADFDEMAARLRTRALSLMKQLDEDGHGYRSLIERELSERLTASRDKGPGSPPTSAPVAVPGLCSCGTANDADALFCKRCGTRFAGRTADEQALSS